MTRPHSDLAIQTLEQLQAQPEKDIVLSFSEQANLRTAEWAVDKFGHILLGDDIKQQYSQIPEQDEDGPLPLEQSTSISWKYGLEEAEATAQDIAADLESSWRRLGRGYSLGHVAVHGSQDAKVIIGSLERAIETNPENLTEAEQHFQAMAALMLDNMQIIDAEIGNSTSYLL
jgi:hypothetical protein